MRDKQTKTIRKVTELLNGAHRKVTDLILEIHGPLDNDQVITLGEFREDLDKCLRRCMQLTS